MSKVWTNEIIQIVTSLLRNGTPRNEICKKLNVSK